MVSSGVTRRAAIGALVVTVAVVVGGWLGRAAVAGGGQAPASNQLDRLLDLYVRDGLVYYAALKSARAPLDRYLATVADEPAGLASWPSGAQAAFWLNAYNALVLRTVIDHYPIRGTSARYPTDSIRQVPGAFAARSHRVAGRAVTLDEIEQTILAELEDPRLSLALGRGAIGSGRLRSEAYTAVELEGQLTAAVEEFAATPRYVELNRLARTVRVSPIFGWREAEFVGAYAERGWTGSGRTPIERAILTLLEPALFPSERAFLAENDFTLRYHEFDWRLNDLTGGRP